MTTSRLPELIRNDRELDDFWRAMMGRLGFSSRRLWLVMIEPDGVPIPQVMQVDDVPLTMSEDEAANLMHAFGWPVRDEMPGGSLAILFTRPGRDRMNAADRELALQIIGASVRAAVPLQPVFFANDSELRMFSVDDLLPMRSIK